MTITRRAFLGASALAGGSALLVAGGGEAFAATPGAGPAFRRSRLFPDSRLVFADMHNHTMFSGSATGTPEQAYQAMRDRGLDVAAVTDHTLGGRLVPPHGATDDTRTNGGMNQKEWLATAAAANAANANGSFTAIRGFEWTAAATGHVNVWFGDTWTDPISTQATTGNIEGFHAWLRSSPRTRFTGGGADSLAGFNHPTAFGGDFGGFQFDPDLLGRVVSIELFNGGVDQLFNTVDQGGVSPLTRALDSGWHVAPLGVSDEHQSRWGALPSLGRAGMYVRSLSRAGVFDAMTDRRFYSTVVAGLRLDASANGVPMGDTLTHRRGSISLQIDIDGGRDWVGRPLTVQVLQTGSPLPKVIDSFDVQVPDPRQPVLEHVLEVVNIDDGHWLALRIVDPTQPLDARATGAYAKGGGAIAYGVFFLAPSEAETRRLRSRTTGLR